MDHNLIDQQILALLRTPVEQRTVENLAAALHSIATAASLVEAPFTAPHADLQRLINLHREQVKLSYYSELLLPVLGYTSYDVCLYANTGDYGSNVTLSTILSPKTDFSASANELPTLFGSGKTAQDALRDLHPIAKREQAA
ncbi:hypothetical protein PF66_02387 [Pseudomonas asplenii]|uniref:Uncharacterized protein n=1 Tax=Pseudomonas asplenii TaxID=53407 RepID=A0A0M9GH31_9PSED|nr:hypothetical protein [Pseudomonas fuscovaginae]KPA91049.1 hypothetical protein PF66_02387 [Pseudomonas fuscovaginae]